ncbi:MAG: DNA methyltransferase [Dethiobacteria bacterium]
MPPGLGQMAGANYRNRKRETYYRLFFREAGTGEAYDEYQKQGDFSPAEIRTLIEQLEGVTVCDPAAGSGAFEVGMLQVLEQVLENLYSRNNTPGDLKAAKPTPFKRKKDIIAHSLYGVETKRWAVWINQLRLWLTLFVDMPEEDRSSLRAVAAQFNLQGAHRRFTGAARWRQNLSRAGPRQFAAGNQAQGHPA